MLKGFFQINYLSMLIYYFDKLKILNINFVTLNRIQTQVASINQSINENSILLASIGCREPVDIVFAIDASTSIGHENFEQVTDFVRDIVEGLRIGTPDSRTPTRVGVMTYADNTDILFHLNVSMIYTIFDQLSCLTFLSQCSRFLDISFRH